MLINSIGRSEGLMEVFEITHVARVADKKECRIDRSC